MAAGTAERTEWRRRRVAAWLVRASTVVVPVVLAVAVSIVLGKLLPTANGWVRSTARVLLILGLTTLAMMWASRRMQRLLPLAMMLKLSWVFPDDVPSRFSVALRRSAPRAVSGDVPEAAAITEQLLDLIRRLNAHHRATRGHSERVRAYADLLGEEMGLSEGDRERLRWAAVLHDIGKLDVPTDILDLPGRPDDEQWAVLAQHPQRGQALASATAGWLGDWARGVWEHHERWDGTGYPARTKGEAISLSGRIIAVADSFETMTAVRSYKRPMSIAAARQELVACSGSHFDPTVVRAFLNVGLGVLGRVRGVVALVQAPLVAVAQAGVPIRNALRAGAAGAAAVLAMAVGSLLAPPSAAGSSQTAAVVTTSTIGSPITGGASDSAGSASATPAAATSGTSPATSTATTAASTSTASTSTTSTTTTPSKPTAGKPAARPAPMTTVPASTVPSSIAPDTSVTLPTSTSSTISVTTTTTTVPSSTTTTSAVPTTTTTTSTTTTTAPTLDAVDDDYTVAPGVDTVIDPLANDVGSLDVSTIAVVDSPPGVNVDELADGTLRVRPAPGHANSVKIVIYQICDVTSACAQASITLHVLP